MVWNISDGAIMNKGDKIYSRSISVDCYEHDEGTLLLEGTLRDERFFPYLVYASGEIEDPGIIHGMNISMTLELPTLTIRNVTAQMPTIPMPGCDESRTSLEKLNNLQVKPGLTNDVRKIIGKTEGCLHLTNLVLAMLAAAMQGVWAYYSRIKGDRPIQAPEVNLSFMINSCWMWREGGALATNIQSLKEELSDAERS